MKTVHRHFFAADSIERLASQDSLLHRIDAKAKIIVTLVLLIVVVSYNKYTVTELLPYLFFPVAMAIAANLPSGFMLTRVAMVLPFALAVCIFNPLLDHVPMAQIGPITISGGWLSFASTMLKFFITVSATIILLASTGIVAICRALEQLGLPQTISVQIMLLYRYLFVLKDEFLRVTRAHANRTFTREGMRLRVYIRILGTMLIRSIDRSQHIFNAMECRGFNGSIHPARPPDRLQLRDYLFATGCSLLIILLRSGLLTGLLQTTTGGR